MQSLKPNLDTSVEGMKSIMNTLGSQLGKHGGWRDDEFDNIQDLLWKVLQALEQYHTWFHGEFDKAEAFMDEVRETETREKMTSEGGPASSQPEPQ